MKEKLAGFTAKYKEVWKFVKFLFTGAGSSAIELVVYGILYYGVFASLQGVPAPENAFLSFLGIEYMGYLYSYLISGIVGYAIAYIVNRKVTFKSDANPLVSTILYAIMVVCTIIFNTWFGAFLGTLLTNNGLDNVFMNLLLKIIVMIVPTLWTYPLSRFVIHRKKKEPQE